MAQSDSHPNCPTATPFHGNRDRYKRKSALTIEENIILFCLIPRPMALT